MHDRTLNFEINSNKVLLNQFVWDFYTSKIHMSSCYIPKMRLIGSKLMVSQHFENWYFFIEGHAQTLNFDINSNRDHLYQFAQKLIHTKKSIWADTLPKHLSISAKMMVSWYFENWQFSWVIHGLSVPENFDIPWSYCPSDLDLQSWTLLGYWRTCGALWTSV